MSDALILLEAAHEILTSLRSLDGSPLPTLAENANLLLSDAADILSGSAAGHAKNARNMADTIAIALRKGEEPHDERLAYAIAEVVQAMEEVRGSPQY